MAVLFYLPNAAPVASGSSYPGAKLYFYLTGTSTSATVYTDDALTTAHANPVVADSSGVFDPIYLDSSVSYRVVLKTSAGVTLRDADPFPAVFADAESIGEILWPRTTAEIAASVTPTDYSYAPLDVRRYGADPTGASNSHGALTNAVTVARQGGGEVTIPAGTYLVDATWALGYAKLRVRGEGTVIIRASGTVSPVVSIDAGEAAIIYEHSLENVTIDAAGNNVGLYVRNAVHRVTRNVRVRNAATYAVHIEGDVLSLYDNVIVSDNEAAFTTNPTHGFYIDDSAYVSATSACTFLNCMVEEATTAGFYLADCDSSLFVGGTSEGLTGGTGIYIAASCTGNTFVNMFCEANATGGDLVCYGKGNEFRNCVMNSRAADSPYESVKSVLFEAGSERNRFIGGQFYCIALEATAVANEIDHADGTLIEDAGTDTHVTWTRALDDSADIKPTVASTYTATLTGVNATVTGSVEYSVNYDLVTLEIPEITGTSNTTAATLTGMPTAIRPAAAQTVIGITTDNGTTAFGKLIVGTDGTITLHFAQSASFTNSGTKGVGACTVTYRRK